MLRLSLDNSGPPLSTTDTGIGQTVASIPDFQNTGKSAHQTDTRSSQSVPDGRSPSHHIDSIRADPHLLGAVQDDDTEGLIDLPVIDVLYLQACFFQGHAAGRHRTHPHDGRIHSGESDGSDVCHWLDPFSLGALFGHQDHRGRCSVQGGGIPGCYNAIGFKGWLEVSHALQRSVIPNGLVSIYDQSLSVCLLSFDGEDFIFEKALLISLGSQLVGASSPAIHIFFGKSSLSKKLLRGEPHICSRHHVPVLVGRLRKKTHVQRDDSLFLKGSVHGDPGHMFHSSDHHDVCIAHGNFHKADMNGSHG